MAKKAKAVEIPVGVTAADILRLVGANEITKAAGLSYLITRSQARVDAGKIPTKPSVEAIETLGGEFEYDRDELRTAKQIAKGTDTLAVRKAAPKKGKAKAAKVAKSGDVNESVAALIDQFGKADLLAAFIGSGK